MQIGPCKAFAEFLQENKLLLLQDLIRESGDFKNTETKKTSAYAEVIDGEPARTRTGDQKIKSLLLYQLSYEPHQSPVPNIREGLCQHNFDGFKN